MVAGDERHVFVGAEILQQLEELAGIRQPVSFQQRLHHLHQLRRIQRLVLARDRDIENQDRLVRRFAILVNECRRIVLLVQLNSATRLRSPRCHTDLHRAEMRKLFVCLVVCLESKNRKPCHADVEARERVGRELQRLGHRNVFVQTFKRNCATPIRIVLETICLT